MAYQVTVNLHSMLDLISPCHQLFKKLWEVSCEPAAFIQKNRESRVTPALF